MAHLKAASLFGIAGKVALVTGGSRGIGSMIAKAFVANGAKVYISSRKADQCNQMADSLNEYAASISSEGSCHSLPADQGTTEGCLKLVSDLKEKEKALHILVNNSGTSWGQPLETFSEKGWDKVLELNVKAPFTMIKECLPLLDEAGKDFNDPARVINIGSIVGLRPQAVPTYSYDASKAALHSLTTKLGAELPRRANKSCITVNAIAPGYVPSEMSKGLNQTGGSHEDFYAEISKHHPIGRVGSESDMGGAALFLASPASAWVTGVVIPVDGGVTAKPPMSMEV